MLATTVLSIKFRYTILGQKYALVRALIPYDELKKRYLKTKHYKFRRIEYVKSTHIGKRYAVEDDDTVRPEYKIISEGDNLLDFCQWLAPIVTFRAFRLDLGLSSEDSPKIWYVVIGDYRGARTYPREDKQKYIIYNTINFIKNKINFLVDKITSYII